MTKVLSLLALVLLFHTHGVKASGYTQWLQTVDNWEDLEKGFLQPNHPAFLGSTRSKLPSSDTHDYDRKAALVRFYLYTDYYTRFQPTELIYDDLASVRYSKFNRSNPVKIFIHGFGHGANCSFPQEIKDLYLAQGHRVNIIAVDWSTLAMEVRLLDPVYTMVNYEIAVDNVPIVGRRVGEMISFLYRNRFTYLSRVHIVGFSLGAHVAGYAGEKVYRMWLSRVARITGLDPAGPLFFTDQHGRHLNRNDAEFVDFIHTDVGQSGTIKPMGHANFFINGGLPPQPGCIENVLRSNFFTAIPSALFGSCSHSTAPLYYAQSIYMSEDDLSSRSCFNYMAYRFGMCLFRPKAVLGENCDPNVLGDFYIDIRPMQSSRLYSC